MRFLILIMLLFSQIVLASEIDIVKIQQSIHDRGAHWTAAETWRTRLTSEQRRLSLGLIRTPQPAERLFKLPPAPVLPSHFSWRKNNGDFVTSVKDQMLCGACSYFSTCAAVESWMRIKNNNARLDIDLSEQFALSCGYVGSCDGADIGLVHEFIMTTGVPQEDCFPYRQDDKLPCDGACPDYPDQLVTIGSYVTLSHGHFTVDDFKNAIYHRPVVAGFSVYTDFNAYNGGVYEHVDGKYEGGHAVLVYGWDDSLQCWLCKNSWGPDWGEAGHFKIKWGDSEFGYPVVMIWDEKNAASSLETEPAALNLTMTPGEQTRRYILLKNNGTGPVEYVVRAVINTIDGMYGGYPADSYITCPFGTGSLAGQDWIALPINISIDETTFGVISGYIEIVTNQNDNANILIPVTIDVKYSEQDYAVAAMSLPSFQWPVFAVFHPEIQIQNWGQTSGGDLLLSCKISDYEGNAVYDKIVTHGSVSVGSRTTVRFPEFSFQESGFYKFVFKITALMDDNEYNNEYAEWVSANDILDDFESESVLWNTGVSWGIAENFSGGHESRYFMHVNHGEQYHNNMLSDLTLRYSLDLSTYNSADLQFWMRYFMEAGNDYLLIQTSLDSTTWISVDSLTGNSLRWNEHHVDISRFTGPDYKKVYLRFRFISNETQTAIGMMIDDVRIKAEYKSHTRGKQPDQAPRSFVLKPNHPNPFNPVTVIPYDCAETALIQIDIVNLSGQLVENLVNSFHAAGSYSVDWNAGARPSGLYICVMDIQTLNGERYSLSNRMLLLR